MIGDWIVDRLPGWGEPSRAQIRDMVVRSGLFDEAYYREHNPDVAASGMDAAMHFVRFGGIEGRHPSRKFDARFYLERNGDVAEAKLNPLVHYLQYGRDEGRPIRGLPPIAPRPKAPSAEQWRSLVARRQVATKAGAVDVIIPVYRGFDETAHCIHSVLRSQRDHELNCEVVVVDDAGPDAELRSLLVELEQLRLITLIRNDKNRGFVESVNSGMQLHPDRDVILLNSDTEVHGDWVGRLRAAAYSATDIGTVTPLSNNATICSYPTFPEDFDGAFEVDFQELDALAREANAGVTVDVPTGVGFCMFIRRRCIEDAGYFDAETFKTGYGEENDFCLRIAARGWRNVLAGDVFVRHLGRVSFRDMANDRLTDALAQLDARYPSYHRDVQAFITADPPRAVRHGLDIARLTRAAGRRIFVFVMHGEGGGTVKHVRDLTADLHQAGVGVLLLRPMVGNGAIAELSHPDVGTLSGAHRIDLRHGLAHGIDVFRRLGVEHIHVHHLLGYSLEAIDFMPKLAAGCGISYDFTFHDYLPACPRIDMIDGTGVYCDNLDVNRCETCISRYGSIFGDVAVWEWRERYGRMLRGARRLFVPNADVRRRLQALFPGLDPVVRAHRESAEIVALHAPSSPRVASGERRFAIIGGISTRKGSRILLAMARDALERRLPIRFVIVGHSDLPELKTLKNVETLGPYDERDLPGLLAASGCRIALFPGVWPETYSYTLSEAYRADCFPVAFDIGAIADRIRSSGWGRVLPLELARQPSAVNDLLCDVRVDPRPADFAIPVGAYEPTRVLEQYYDMPQSRSTGAGRPG